MNKIRKIFTSNVYWTFADVADFPDQTTQRDGNPSTFSVCPTSDTCLSNKHSQFHALKNL